MTGERPLASEFYGELLIAGQYEVALLIVHGHRHRDMAFAIGRRQLRDLDRRIERVSDK